MLASSTLYHPFHNDHNKKLLLKINNKEKFQDSIKILKREIYEACGFRVAESRYDRIVQKLLLKDARFTTNKEYII